MKEGNETDEDFNFTVIFYNLFLKRFEGNVKKLAGLCGIIL
jgi:hypothetical protein